MSGEEKLEELVAEKKAAYLEHWRNTELLVAVEKEWRLAKERGDEERIMALMTEVEQGRVKAEKSKERARQVTVKLQQATTEK